MTINYFREGMVTVHQNGTKTFLPFAEMVAYALQLDARIATMTEDVTHLKAGITACTEGEAMPLDYLMQ